MSRQWYLILAVCGSIFLFNYVLPSDLNNWATSLNFSLDPLLHDAVMQAETEWKHQNSEFGRRPFMINVMRYGTRWTGWPSPLVFTLVQFLGLLLTLWTLHRLTVRVWPDWLHPPLGVLPFLLVFPSIFLFTARAHTYDDLYQYALLLGVLYGAVDRRPLLAIACAGAACIVRETSVLFLPILAYLLGQRAGWPAWKAVAAAGLAGGAAALFVWWYVPAELAEKTTLLQPGTTPVRLESNFADYARTSETLVLTLVILVPFLGVAYRYRDEIHRQPLPRELAYAALYLCLINTAAVYVAALAREARLLVLPLLPLLPVVAPFLVRACRRGALRWREYSGLAWVVALAVALGVTLAYRPSVGGTGYFYRAYVFCWVAAWALVLFRMFFPARGGRAVGTP